MIAGMSIVRFLLTSLIAGVSGMTAFDAMMNLIARRGSASGKMVAAVGSLITRRHENAMAIGSAVHAFSAIVFAMLYLSLMLKFGFTRVASSLPAGIGFGLIHGVVVSLFLLWAVADQHPLEEFRNPSLGVVLSHLAGHVAYGAVVGLVIGISTS